MTRSLLALILLVAVATGALAADPTDPAEMDSKTLYRTYCKACHDEGSEAGEYAPLHLIMDQWDEFFDTIEETHAEATLEATAGKPVAEFLGSDLLDELRKFCVDHAADSEEPMTCG